MVAQILGFLNKLFFALGAGDGDFALTPGHSHRLAAAGAVKISVFLILPPLDQPQVLPVLLVPLIGIPGKTPKNRPKHQSVGASRQRHIQKRQMQEHIHQGAYKSCR